jgi:predicted DNA-binding transcriptional regulator AlpA
MSQADAPSPTFDELVPDPKVQREFGITAMTLWRWTKDPELSFPPPIKIRERNHRSRRAIEEFKARMIQRGIEQRAQRVA